MDILIVHPYMSIFGGGERVCFHILKALVEEGHNVTLVSEPINDEKFKKFIGFDLPSEVNYVFIKKFEPKILKFMVYQRRLHYLLSKRKLKLGNFDVEILTQDITLTLNAGKRIIAYVHFPNYLAHLETPRGTKAFWKLYYAPIEWYLDCLKNKALEKDELLCNSNFTRRHIMERWKVDAKVLYPPVEVHKFKPGKKEDTVISVGRFVPSKNYEIVLGVARRMPDVKFKIIGIKQDIKYFEKLKRNKPSNVNLLPNVEHEKVIEHLSRAKVYLHTMINEHFGISIVEAMASGCIPVVHDSGGAVEAIGKFGYKYRTIDECASCIRAALATKVDINKLVNWASKFSSESFRSEFKDFFNNFTEKLKTRK